VETLKALLATRLKNAKKTAILAVGSSLRGDDAAGLLVARYLNQSLPKTKGKRSFKVFIGETAPENFTGEIRRFEPSHILIVDCAEFADKPGAVKLMTPQETHGVTFSTHSLPPRVMAQYLSDSFPCEIMIIGIQPKSLKFNESPSKEVRASCRKVAQSIRDALS
jgi:hydrogenase 3 maturation protease